jgi:hypothetical protein
MRPAYFVVVLDFFGRETPAIFWDEPPRAIRRMVYIVRLDQFPNGERLVKASLPQLFAVYRALKARGKLPPRWQPPPRSTAGPAQRKAGHREYHARRFMPDLPYEA